MRIEVVRKASRPPSEFIREASRSEVTSRQWVGLDRVARVAQAGFAEKTYHSLVNAICDAKEGNLFDPSCELAEADLRICEGAPFLSAKSLRRILASPESCEALAMLKTPIMERGLKLLSKAAE